MGALALFSAGTSIASFFIQQDQNERGKNLQLDALLQRKQLQTSNLTSDFGSAKQKIEFQGLTAFDQFVVRNRTAGVFGGNQRLRVAQQAALQQTEIRRKLDMGIAQIKQQTTLDERFVQLKFQNEQTNIALGLANNLGSIAQNTLGQVQQTIGQSAGLLGK